MKASLISSQILLEIFHIYIAIHCIIRRTRSTLYNQYSCMMLSEIHNLYKMAVTVKYFFPILHNINLPDKIAPIQENY